MMGVVICIFAMVFIISLGRYALEEGQRKEQQKNFKKNFENFDKNNKKN